MPDMILDGTGRGNIAGVNTDNQLRTRATSVEQRLESTLDSNYYESTTSRTEITNDTETPIVYIENLDSNSNNVLVIDRIFYDVWETTGGSGLGTLEYYRNPVRTGGSDMAIYNTNFGSNVVPEGYFIKRPTTMTGVEWWHAVLAAETSVAIEEGRFSIPQGRSFGIAIVPPTGNTSMYVSINIGMYTLDTRLIK